MKINLKALTMFWLTVVIVIAFACTLTSIPMPSMSNVIDVEYKSHEAQTSFNDNVLNGRSVTIDSSGYCKLRKTLLYGPKSILTENLQNGISITDHNQIQQFTEKHNDLRALEEILISFDVTTLSGQEIVFSHWRYSADAYTIKNSGALYQDAGNVTSTGTYDRPKVVFSFDCDNDGICESTQNLVLTYNMNNGVFAGRMIMPVPEATPGYTFIGYTATVADAHANTEFAPGDTYYINNSHIGKNIRISGNREPDRHVLITDGSTEHDVFSDISASIVYGGTYQFHAPTANVGYNITGWTYRMGNSVETALPTNNLIENVTADVVITATFTQVSTPISESYMLTTGVYPDAYSGKVDIVADGKTIPNGSKVASGTLITLKVTPAAGKVFLGWRNSSSQDQLQGGLSYTFSMPKTDCSVIAYLGMSIDDTAPALYELSYFGGTVNNDGDGLLISSALLQENQQVSVAAVPQTPREGYCFSHWTSNGTDVWQPDATFTMCSQNVRLVAVWKKLSMGVSYTITYKFGSDKKLVQTYTAEDGETITGPEKVTGVDGYEYIALMPFSLKVVSGTLNAIDVACAWNLRTEADLRALSAKVETGTTYEGLEVWVGYDIAMYYSAAWIPISSEHHIFKGIFDGKNNIIKNLTINTPNPTSDGVCQGLFGCLNGNAVIRNVKLRDVDITAGHYFGGIVGWMQGVTVSNCYVSGEIKYGKGSFSTLACMGGIAGWVNYASLPTQQTVIEQCESSATVSAAGTNEYSMSNCVGGIVGYAKSYNENSVYIKECSNAGNVTGHKNVGGIVGYIYGNNNDPVYIQDCYNSGDITATGIDDGYVGGIAGYSVSNGYRIYKCYNYGRIFGADSASQYKSKGAILGYVAGTSKCMCVYTLDSEYTVGKYYNTFFTEKYSREQLMGITDKLNAPVGAGDYTADGEILWRDDFSDKPINNGNPILAWQDTDSLVAPGYVKVRFMSDTTGENVEFGLSMSGSSGSIAVALLPAIHRQDKYTAMKKGSVIIPQQATTQKRNATQSVVK